MDEEYSLYIVALCDVLGFSALIESSDGAAGPARTLDFFRRTSDPDPEIAQLYEKHFLNFSDTFVRPTHVRSDANLLTIELHLKAE